MNGTSASAPHVTGLIALMLEYAVLLKKELSWKDIQGMVKAGASRATLLPNRHIDADDTRKPKQEDVWNDLIGAGKVNVCETLKNFK